MAIWTIPTTSDEPSYRQVTDLGGRDYQLRIDWCERAGLWLLDLITTEGTDVMRGAALVPGVLLLRRSTHPDRPRGDLLVTGEPGDEEVGRFHLGTRSQLLYIDGEDLAEILAARAEQPAS